MIPGGDALKTALKFKELPTRTFKVNTQTETIGGYSDEQAAMKQAIYLILSVERYQYLIYSRNYGVELASLIGMPVSFCLPEIKRRITEALLQDKRITDVSNFTFETTKGKVFVTFIADTIFGAVDVTKAVNI